MGAINIRKATEFPKDILIDSLLICRTNGIILTEFNHQIERVSTTTLEVIKNQVIDHSRKLFTQTYDKQLIHLTLQSSQVYYKTYCNVLFIAIFPIQYNTTLIDGLFETIISKYQEQTKRIFGLKNIPNKLTKFEETQMKMFQNKIATVLREIQGNGQSKYTSINDSTHSNVGETGYTFKRVSQRDQHLNSYRELNKINPMTQELQQTMKKIEMILLLKKYSIIFLYIVTIWIGIWIITSN